MYARHRVRCPRCGRELEFPLTPDVVRRAREAPDGLARVALPHDGHVLVVQIDQFGAVRNMATGDLLQRAEECSVVEGRAPASIEGRLRAIARQGGPRDEAERTLWEYAKRAGYVVCR